jgi:hypothetical protein
VSEELLAAGSKVAGPELKPSTTQMAIKRNYRLSIDSLATGWTTGGRRVQSSSSDSVKNFHFTISSRPAVGSTQVPSQWETGYPSPGVKRQVSEADHSTLISVHVKKKTLIFTPTPSGTNSLLPFKNSDDILNFQRYVGFITTYPNRPLTEY